jgi:hypothetical protein
MVIFSDVDRDEGLMAASERPFPLERLSSWSDESMEGSGVASGVEPIVAKEGGRR